MKQQNISEFCLSFHSIFFVLAPKNVLLLWRPTVSFCRCCCYKYTATHFRLFHDLFLLLIEISPWAITIILHYYEQRVFVFIWLTTKKENCSINSTGWHGAGKDRSCPELYNSKNPLPIWFAHHCNISIQLSYVDFCCMNQTASHTKWIHNANYFVECLQWTA